MKNPEIAKVFSEMGDILDLQGANPFRIRAYQKAAFVIENLSESLSEMAEAHPERLTDLAGIGKDLAGKIVELVRTGTFKEFEELKKKVPLDLVNMMHLRGLGPKKVKALHEKLKIKNMNDLEKAVRAHKVQTLPGFGAKVEENILKAIGSFRQSEARFKLWRAEPYADSLVAYLKRVKEVTRVEAAGSFRRHCETIGDLDILVCGTNGPAVMDAFVKHEDVRSVLAKGETKTTVQLKNNLQVDVRFLEPESFGSALHYFTGSKLHNIRIRSLAKDKGLKVNEYGVFRGARRVGGREEVEVFRSVGLPLVPPELREDRGEIEAAQKGKLPHLIELSDIKGDLHCHTQETDGANTIEEMAEAARKLGYEYIAITDHSKSTRVANGMDEKRLLRQVKQIEKANARVRGIQILKGIEVDILDEGKLDLADDVLKELDIVVASIHSKWSMPAKQMTERIIRAMQNKYVRVLAHPTGRLIHEREPYEVEMEKILKVAANEGVWVELNAYPDRLDLKDIHCQMAKSLGVKIVICTDSHNSNQLAVMKYGVWTARRGWLEKKDVVNTLPLASLLRALRK